MATGSLFILSANCNNWGVLGGLQTVSSMLYYTHRSNLSHLV